MIAADNRWLTLSQFIPAFQSTYADGPMMQYNPPLPHGLQGLPAQQLLGGPPALPTLGWSVPQQQQQQAAAAPPLRLNSLPEGAVPLGSNSAAALAGRHQNTLPTMSGVSTLGQPPPAAQNSGRSSVPTAVDLQARENDPLVSPFVPVASVPRHDEQQQQQQQQAHPLQQQRQQLPQGPVVAMPRGIAGTGPGVSRPLSQISAPSVGMDLPGEGCACVPAWPACAAPRDACVVAWAAGVVAGEPVLWPGGLVFVVWGSSPWLAWAEWNSHQWTGGALAHAHGRAPPPHPPRALPAAAAGQHPLGGMPDEDVGLFDSSMLEHLLNG